MQNPRDFFRKQCCTIIYFFIIAKKYFYKLQGQHCMIIGVQLLVVF